MTTLLVIYLATENTSAQSNSSSIYRFLEIAPTAGVSSPEGGQVGYRYGDFSLMHLNPAYVGLDKGKAVSASYINFLGETNMSFTSLKIDEKDWGSMSFGVKINIGDLPFDISRNSHSNLGG